MSGLVTARWVPSAASVPAAVFDGRYFCTSVAWTRAWESVRTERVLASRHLALEGAGAAELVPYYLVGHSPLWRSYENDAGLPPVWTRPVVYSGTLYGARGGAGGGSRAHLARAVDLGLEQAARWDAEALVFANLTGDEVGAWSAVRPDGVPVLLDRAYAARVGGSEAAFLAALPGKARREFVRQWRRASDAGVRLRVLSGEEMLPRLEEFTALAIEAAEKHGLNLYGADMFRNLVQVPGAVLLVAEHEGTMAGAFYCFLYRGRFSMVTGGIDYARLRELNTYAFLVYESLRHAVAHDAGIIDPGRGNFAYKRRHGFRGTDLWALVYPVGSRPDLADTLGRMSKNIRELIALTAGPL